MTTPTASTATAAPIYLTDVELLCSECHQSIRARINTCNWLRVEWIGPSGECLSCYQKAKESNGGPRRETAIETVSE